MVSMVPGARNAVGSKMAPALLGLPVEWCGKIKRASQERKNPMRWGQRHTVRFMLASQGRGMCACACVCMRTCQGCDDSWNT